MGDLSPCSSILTEVTESSVVGEGVVCSSSAPS